MSAEYCFHCQSPVGDGARRVQVDGEDRSVCSERCSMIVSRIAERGLSRFYRFRNAATPPVDNGSTSSRWTTYDRTSVQRAFVADAPGGGRTASLVIDGVRCAACSWLIEEAMSAEAGVRAVTIDPLTARAEITFDPATIPLSAILEQIASLGYRPFPFTAESVEQAVADEQRRSLRRLIVAGLGMMQVTSFAGALYLGAFDGMDPAIEQFLRLISMLVATPVVLYSGAPFFDGAWRALRNRRLGMDVPVALAIGAAYAASVWNSLTGVGEVYFDSCTMFVFLLSAARFLERAGRRRALNMTRVLASHLPHAATRLRAGVAEEVGVMELEAGDVVLVGTGAVIPADGILDAGGDEQVARIDESLVTGESIPVPRRDREAVMAGSVNAGRPIRIVVTRTGAETVMAQISRLVTDAREERPPVVEMADRRASLFLAVVHIGACIVGLYWLMHDPSRAFSAVLAVLVVTCPCALSLATPAAFTIASSALARQGFLVRRTGALTTLAAVGEVVLDKTGTLTEHTTGLGTIEVAGRATIEGATEIAAVLESYSDHPLARAFPKPARADGATEVRVVAGQGVEGRIAGERYRIGRREFAAAIAPKDPDSGRFAAEADSGPQAWLGGERGLIARFEIAERFRPGAAQAVAALRQLGIDVSVASGDRDGPVAAAATRLGIDTWRANLRPADKLALIRDKQAAGVAVAMVGDGINDAPVLAGASVSIAIGTGTALAHHSADCVLMTSTLMPLAEAIEMARRTTRVIRQNLAWSATYNLIALPLAGAGILTPWMAAIGMSISSLLVTGNALRLGRSRSGTAARVQATAARAGAVS